MRKSIIIDNLTEDERDNIIKELMKKYPNTNIITNINNIEDEETQKEILYYKENHPGVEVNYLIVKV